MASLKDHDYVIKLITLGDSGVGKTNILSRFTKGAFLNSLATVGLDLYEQIVTVNGSRVLVQIWDTAGQQKFKALTQNYLRGAMGVILVYSIENRMSFGSITMWMKQIESFAEGDIPKVLVGNKADLQNERTVVEREGKRLADSFEISFYETSAKNNTNIKNAIMDLIGKTCRRVQPVLTLRSQVGEGRQCSC